MNNDIEIFEFLLKQKPICSQFPLKSELGEDYEYLRLKYKSEYGFDMLDNRCSNTANCKITNKGCIGRPFPKDDLIKEGLKDLNVEVTVGTHRGKEVYMAKAIVDCHNCPLQLNCENTCLTQHSYIERRVRPDREPRTSNLIPYDEWERDGMKDMLDPEELYYDNSSTWANEEIPWDCLTKKQYQCLDLSLNRGYTYKEISFALNIGSSSVQSHIERAKCKLKEWGLARKALKQEFNKYANEYYNHNKTQKTIAEEYNVRADTVNKSINHWKYKNNVSYK